MTAGQGGTGFIGVQLAKARRGTVITAASRDGFDFVKGLGADVVVDYHEQNMSIPWAMTPWASSSTTWVSQACVTGAIGQSFWDYADRDLGSPR